MYEINGEKLKYYIYSHDLSLAAVARSIGFMPNYFYYCLNNNRLSKTAVKRIYDKYNINPGRYITGWKGETEK